MITPDWKIWKCKSSKKNPRNWRSMLEQLYVCLTWPMWHYSELKCFRHLLGKTAVCLSEFCFADFLLVLFFQDKYKPALAKIFSIMHKSVSDFSNRMLNEMRRHNYVTPTNYLELVSGYKKWVLERFTYFSPISVCVCVCARTCARACVRASVRVCVCVCVSV